MPVQDQGLAKSAQQAGTDISKAISDPLSKSVSGAGQAIDTGVNTAANTVSGTASGILAGSEKYIGTFFTYLFVGVAGLILIAVGAAKLGAAPKVSFG
jgi:hypothetical protein